jgi:hypothetical protein
MSALRHTTAVEGSLELDAHEQCATSGRVLSLLTPTEYKWLGQHTTSKACLCCHYPLSVTIKAHPAGLTVFGSEQLDQSD